MSDMFIKLEGIDGESKDDEHTGEIDVLGWNWGMSQSGSMHQGGGGGRGKVNVQDLTFLHYLDKATGNLMLCCAKGSHIPEAKLVVRKAGEDPLEYLIITMTDCIVTSISTAASQGDEMLSEQVSINFAKVKVEYQEQLPDGSGTPGPEFAWDMEKNVKA
ncbi:type VI secretion system tube protein Hcp [Neptunomonas sp.]|uniref:Hcp family type VI secretion system effector n=1 Tax=Neptunomonas sp. TaxID=1971898 RepID=UPI0025F20A1B|nr:type VI secretion system tube protein Hcp [Neptunomonas sp.]